MRLVAVFKESEHRLKMIQTCANHRSNQNGEFYFSHIVSSIWSKEDLLISFCRVPLITVQKIVLFIK